MAEVIKAIPTSYARQTFRSRLEARWAVYFNEIETRWWYEFCTVTHGSSGHSYTPDFVLCPRMHIEIKPSKPSTDYLEKLLRFAFTVNLVLIIGSPDNASVIVVPSEWGRSLNKFATVDIDGAYKSGPTVLFDCPAGGWLTSHIECFDPYLLLGHGPFRGDAQEMDDAREAYDVAVKAARFASNYRFDLENGGASR